MRFRLYAKQAKTKKNQTLKSGNFEESTRKRRNQTLDTRNFEDSTRKLRNRSCKMLTHRRSQRLLTINYQSENSLTVAIILSLDGNDRDREWKFDIKSWDWHWKIGFLYGGNGNWKPAKNSVRVWKLKFGGLYLFFIFSFICHQFFFFINVWKKKLKQSYLRWSGGDRFGSRYFFLSFWCVSFCEPEPLILSLRSQTYAIFFFFLLDFSS